MNSKISIRQFEDLPNELVFELFSYFTLDELVQLFWNLNRRLNDLLQSLSNLSIIIDGNPSESVEIFAEQIRDLKLNTANCLDFSRFVRLQRLELSRATLCHLEQIRADLLPNLTELTLLTPFYLSLPNDLLNDLFNNGFPSLRRLRLGRVDLMRNFSTSSISSPALEELQLTFIDPNLIPQILFSCPNLRILQVTFLGQNQHLLPNISSNHHHHQLERFSFYDPYQKLSIETILLLLLFMPNLRFLLLQCSSRMSFSQLIDAIDRYFDHLEEFQCDIREYPQLHRSTLDSLRARRECFANLQSDDDINGYRRIFTE